MFFRVMERVRDESVLQNIVYLSQDLGAMPEIFPYGPDGIRYGRSWSQELDTSLDRLEHRRVIKYDGIRGFEFYGVRGDNAIHFGYVLHRLVPIDKTKIIDREVLESIRLNLTGVNKEGDNRAIEGEYKLDVLVGVLQRAKSLGLDMNEISEMEIEKNLAELGITSGGFLRTKDILELRAKCEMIRESVSLSRSDI